MKENENPPQIMYILPNLFTAASAFCGMISIFATINGDYAKAIFYVVLSLILDGFDGRVARMTNTTSKFGIEFDSLADLIAFGVAPAVLFYHVIGSDFGRLGVLVSGFFAVFGAIRLARFNVTTGTYDPKFFIGLPIPTAAVTLVSWVGIYTKFEIFSGFEWVFLLLALLLAILMVSNVRYPSFKKIDLKKARFLRVLILLVLFFSLFYLYRLQFLVFVTSAYVFYGIARMFYTICTAKFKRIKKG